MAYSGSVASYLLDIDSGVESIPESWHGENEHGVTFMPKLKFLSRKTDIPC